MQVGHECYCGNANDRFNKRPEPECSIPCSGNKTGMCGGDWRLSIYKIDNCTVYTDGTKASTDEGKTTNTAIVQTATNGYSHRKIKDSTPQPVDKTMCSCPCKRMGRSMSVSELDEVVAKIKQELQIDRKNLSSYKRSKRSQTDTRTLSMCMGIVGGIVISIPILSIIICDVINILNRKYLLELYVCFTISRYTDLKNKHEDLSAHKIATTLCYEDHFILLL
ncbi:uncharacterized protein LOC134692193 [Mytilus trossulus]|uniref:uncharacterized protein LOC134692193 n=1 Tax=Mytilus trossulus TaxID=6551 RepID=UPI0030069F8D